MMKKTYIKPEVRVKQLETSALLAGSITLTVGGSYGGGFRAKEGYTTSEDGNEGYVDYDKTNLWQ